MKFLILFLPLIIQAQTSSTITFVGNSEVARFKKESFVDPDELAVMYGPDGDVEIVVRNSISYKKWRKRGWADMRSIYPTEINSSFYMTPKKLEEYTRGLKDEKPVQ